MTAAIDRNFNAQRFYDGDEFFAYKYFGAHKAEKGVTFRTFALNADKVTLIGEFSDWKELDMSDSARKGFWELTVPEAGEGQMYKYVIYSKLGRIEHCDPYGFGMELRPGFASIVRDLDAYQFSDEEWMKERTRNFDRPLNIYELHLGSWKRNPEDPNGWYDYTEIADDLIAYVKKYHYTHVEIMPLSEHPFDGSWGYQNTGFFAPTSRYGTAPQLKELVDRLHRAGIGAIIDFVPAHFATDYYALKEYDGTQLYEYPERLNDNTARHEDTISDKYVMKSTGDDDDEIGIYRTTVVFTPAEIERALYLEASGICGSFKVFINDKLLCNSHALFTRKRLLISGLVKAGVNQITIIVNRFDRDDSGHIILAMMNFGFNRLDSRLTANR